MKKLLVGILAFTSISSFAANDCREVFSSYKAKHLHERISSDVLFGTTIYGGLAVGGIVEATGSFGTAAALGSTLSIGSAFVPALVYLGIEGGIALGNAPYTKAVNLINQSYKYRESKNYKSNLLGRLARKLNLSKADLAETIIRANEDGTLCQDNMSKNDIMDSIRLGDIRTIDVDDESYSGSTKRWTCGAQTRYYQGDIYTASHNKKRLAKKKAKAVCSEQTGEKCKWIIYCENHDTGMISQRF